MRISLILFSFVVTFGCNIPSVNNLNNIKIVNEGLYAIPLSNKEFSDLDRFLSPVESFSNALASIFIPINQEVRNAISNNLSIDVINSALVKLVGDIAPFTSEIPISRFFVFNDLNNSDDVEIISAEIKSGKLIFDFSSYQGPFNLIFEIDIPQFKNRNVHPFKKEITLDRNNLDLVGLLSPNEDGKMLVSLRVKEITYTQDSKNTIVSDIDINPIFKIEAFRFDNIKGYFGRFNIDNAINMSSLFEVLVGKDSPFKFGKTGSVITLSVNNSIGVPIQFDLSDFVFIDSNGKRYNLTDKEGKGLIHDIKTVEFIEEGNIKSFVTDIVISSENTNIDEILAKNPIEIRLNIDLIVNPNGRPSDIQTQFNFLDRNAILKLTGKAQLFLIVDL